MQAAELLTSWFSASTSSCLPFFQPKCHIFLIRKRTISRKHQCKDNIDINLGAVTGNFVVPSVWCLVSELNRHFKSHHVSYDDLLL